MAEIDGLKICFLVPVYNHGAAIGSTIQAIRELTPHLAILLVNDGSDGECTSILRAIDQSDTAIELLELATNRGKGGAIKAGLIRAEALGYSHVLQVDADGQHCLTDIPEMLASSRENPGAIVTGVAIFDQSIPKARLYGRYLTHFWIWVNTLSFDIKDSLCGFRVYPVAAVNRMIKGTNIGNRMDFDPEVLVRWKWAGRQIIGFNTLVRYPTDGVSHFHALEDNYLVSKMHTKLFIMMLVRLPSILWRRIFSRGNSAQRCS